MATLVSPGVDVTIVDESAYASPGAGTIPLVIIATAQDKTDPTGTETDGIAKYTKSANANLVVPVTSQRELTQFFGDPTFASTQGAETSEYGLLAAYSYLGQGAQAYIVRADVDLAELTATDSAPTGPVAASTIWLDTDASSYGLHEWNGTSWVLQDVTVEVDVVAAAGEISAPGTYVPIATAASAPNDGNYLVAVLYDGASPTGVTISYFQNVNGTWDNLDTDWETATTLTASYQPHYSVPAAPGTGDVWVKTTQPGNGVNLAFYQAQADGEFQILEVESVATAVVATQTITAITQANPAVVTVGSTAALTAGETITISGVVGMTEITDGTYTVGAIIDGTTFELAGEDASGYAAPGTAGTVDGIGGVFVAQNGLSLTDITSTLTSGTLALELLNSAVATTSGFAVSTVVSSVATALTGAFEASETEPTGPTTAGQLWFDSTRTELDILIRGASAWERIIAADIQYATVAPILDAGGAALAAGDIWVDTSAGENERPKIYRHDGSAWLLHDNTDQTTDRGVLFDDFVADDRTALASGDINTNLTAFSSAPDYQLYPQGMLAVNMAFSQNTLRVWTEGILVNGGASTVDAWVNAVTNNADGSGAFGRLAQRRYVATQMQAAVAGNEDLRDPARNFTLLVAPNFPELTDELVTLNSDRGETGFIIIDTPMRLTATGATNWILGVGASENGDEGLVTKNTYSAVYYPPGRSTTPAGDTVTVPASHMVLYTYAYNDNIAYPWFAPAGLTRGIVQNGSAVGYITSEEEFKAVSLSQGQRDAMYLNKLNPIANFPLEGVVVFGQKSLHPTSSALDRVNVARLVAYLRERFDEIARPLLFEQNDKITRDRAIQLFENFLADLLTKRALTDFAVVCDESNNTPIRIDRNELYVDVAIAPTKAVEFIYIPIRIVNTGAL